MKRKAFLIFSCAVFVLAAAIGAAIFFSQTREKSNDILSTEGAGYAEEDIPHADPAIVGKWQNTANPQWFKVYYDDYDDEGYFWGKEWDEAENVMEEDLNYHGNGWFRWCKQGKELQELHAMDITETIIPKIYQKLRSSNDSLLLKEKLSKRIDHFGRVQ